MQIQQIYIKRQWWFGRLVVWLFGMVMAGIADIAGIDIVFRLTILLQYRLHYFPVCLIHCARAYRLKIYLRGLV